MPHDTARTAPAEILDLAEQVDELRQTRAAGATPPAGRLLGLPELPDGDVWVDIAGAVAVTGAAERTISSWLARGKPIKAPFPAGRRMLYRLYWPLSVLEEWTKDYKQSAGS